MNLPGNIDLNMAVAVWFRNLTVYRRTWVMNILPNFFEPVLYLVGMGLGLGALVEGSDAIGGSYFAFVAPGLLAAAAMNGASFEATYNMFIKMNFAKLYDAYLSTPAELQDVAFGELLWAVTRALIYGVAFLVILLAFTAFGYRVVTSGWVVLAPLGIALTGTTFALIGQLFTASISVIDLYSYYYTLFLTPSFLFSGIFYPVSRFPKGEEIAWFTPLYHAVRLMRGLCQGDVGVPVLVSAVWLVVAALVLQALVVRRLRARMGR